MKSIVGIDSPQNKLAMFIPTHRNSLNISPRRCHMLVAQCVLRLDDRTGVLCDHAREGMSGLMQVYFSDPRFPRVALEVKRERMRRQRSARPPGTVVPRPQGSII